MLTNCLDYFDGNGQKIYFAGGKLEVEYFFEIWYIVGLFKYFIRLQ